MYLHLLSTFWMLIANLKTCNSKHAILGSFEAIESRGQALAKFLTSFLQEYELKKKIFAFVKDEGSNIEENNYIQSNCDVCVQYKKYFKVHILDMHFPRLINMHY